MKCIYELKNYEESRFSLHMDSLTILCSFDQLINLGDVDQSDRVTIYDLSSF